jgi:hypothetical protein
MAITKQELVELCFQYTQRFRCPLFYWGERITYNDDELADVLRKCLETGKPRRPPPHYDPDKIY